MFEIATRRARDYKKRTERPEVPAGFTARLTLNWLWLLVILGEKKLHSALV